MAGDEARPERSGRSRPRTSATAPATGARGRGGQSGAWARSDGRGGGPGRQLSVGVRGPAHEEGAPGSAAVSVRAVSRPLRCDPGESLSTRAGAARTFPRSLAGTLRAVPRHTGRVHPTPFGTGTVVLDGGLATTLEAAGHDLGGGLWSARVLRERPTAVLDAHRAQLASLSVGKGCIRYRKPEEVDWTLVTSLLAGTKATNAEICT